MAVFVKITMAEASGISLYSEMSVFGHYVEGRYLHYMFATKDVKTRRTFLSIQDEIFKICFEFVHDFDWIRFCGNMYESLKG